MVTHRTTIGIVLFLVMASTAYGGKLGRAREQARGAKSSPAASAPPREPTKEPAPEQKSRPARKPAPPAAAPRKSGKLAAVRAQVRAPQPPRPARAPRPHHAPPRRPRRSHGGWLHARVVPPCPPTVVETHHYYAPAGGVVVSPGVPPEPLPPALPSPVVELPPGGIPDTPMEVILEEPATACPVVTSLPAHYVRFGFDYGEDVDDVQRLGFDLLANATSSWGVDTSARLFREKGVDYQDHLWIGDLNVVYEIMPSEWLRPRAGVGINWLADAWGGEAGLNLTCGADVLLGPITLAGELDFGTLGDADLVHSRVTAGWMPGDALEWFVGYDRLELGGVAIQGVVGGLRVRF